MRSGKSKKTAAAMALKIPPIKLKIIIQANRDI
jgi:hypothetical protein